MCSQVTFIGELFIAYFTVEWFFTGMRVHMLLKRPFSRKPDSAYSAIEISEIVMSAHMVFEMAVRPEFPHTINHAALIRLLPRVNEEMSLEVTFFIKCLAAYFAVEWLSTFMHSQMNFKPV